MKGTNRLFPIVLSMLIIMTLLPGFTAWWGFSRLARYYRLEDQKHTTELALGYNRRLQDTDLQDGSLKSEAEELEKNQAYLWLLGTYEGQIKTRMVLGLLGFSAVLMVIAAFIIYLVLRIQAAPLNAIAHSLHEFTSGKKVSALDPSAFFISRRAIGDFNILLEELYQGRLRERIQDSYEGTQSGIRLLVHEMKNCLTPAILSVETVAPAFLEGEYKDDWYLVKHNLERAEKLLGRFRSFASLPEPVCDELEIKALVEEVAAELAKTHPDWTIQLKGTKLFLYSDRVYWNRILYNLLLNSVQSRDKGKIKVELDASIPRIRIEDDGPGLPDLIKADPFKGGYSGHPEGEGLGLFLVRGMTEIMGWKIGVEATEEGSRWILEDADGKS